MIADGIAAESFWIEADANDDQRSMRGRNAGAIASKHALLDARARAMTNHLPPDEYLW